MATSIAILASPLREAAAESLSEAIKAASETNPSLLRQRALQRALDETYVQARGGWRPSLSVQASTSGTRQDLGGQGEQLISDGTGNLIIAQAGSSPTYNSGSANVRLSQPIYTGGKVLAAVDAAEADILAGRQNLRAAENEVFRSVIQAFADVREDFDIIGVRRENVSALAQEVRQVQAKLELGQATRVDTAQAQSQYAASQAQLRSSEGQLQISIAAFTAIVGHPPGELSADMPLPALPEHIDDILSLAERNSPLLRQAAFNELASHFRVDQARAATRPSVSADVTAGYTGPIAPFAGNDFNRTIIASLNFTQQFYSGGVLSSQVRQALAHEEADRLAVDAARRAILQNISQSLNSLQVASENLTTTSRQEETAKLAFEGLTEQNRVGTASMIDLLVQEQQYRDAQLAVISARHDLTVSKAALLATLGELSLSHLVPGEIDYDAAASFRKIDAAARLAIEVLPQSIDQVLRPSH